MREVGRDTLDPVLFLLGSHDGEVQRAASAALGNLAVNGEHPSACVVRPSTKLKSGAVRSGKQTPHRSTGWIGASHQANAESERGSSMQCSWMRDQLGYSW